MSHYANKMHDVILVTGSTQRIYLWSEQSRFTVVDDMYEKFRTVWRSGFSSYASGHRYIHT